MPKGAPDGHKIHFSEKADEIPDGEAGDVVFVLQEQPHPEYKRKGDDLFLERTISLGEALCGFNMELKSLDDRTLIIKSAPGEVIKHVAYDPFREEVGATRAPTPTPAREEARAAPPPLTGRPPDWPCGSSPPYADCGITLSLTPPLSRPLSLTPPLCRPHPCADPRARRRCGRCSRTPTARRSTTRRLRRRRT